MIRRRGWIWRAALVASVLSQLSCVELTERRVEPTERRIQLLQAAVWADDDSEIAVVINTYELGRDFIDIIPRVASSARLELESVATGVRTLVTDQLGSADRGLYYMKTRGYFIVLTNTETHSAYYKVSLTGERTLIQLAVLGSCVGAPSGFVPSPDGLHLAAVARTNCSGGAVDPNVPNGLIVILYDAATLVEVRRDSLSTPPSMTTTNVNWTWRPAGDFVLQDKAWGLHSMHPSRAAITTTLPACWRPMTSSSDVSSTGTWLGLTGSRVERTPSSTRPRFGCQ